MGTHPIFESDFDCLTDWNSRIFVNNSKKMSRFHCILKRVSNPANVSNSIKNAVICQNGVLTNQFRYISDMRRDKKKVLILGAGYVTPPVVDYLASQGHEISLVSALENEAQNLISKHNFNATGYTFDCVGDQEQLGSMIGEHDLVISLLPYVFHPMVAKLAIDKKVNMVTASYLSPGMEELDSLAKSSGITVVNEVGVDPGIDHMLAMELFHELQENGEEIKSFVSFCGGLPAPEASNNPLGYKFSWSPRGVLLNTISGAQWLHSNRTDGIEAGGEIINKPYQFSGKEGEVKFSTWKGFSLEGLPNRDSTKYREPYNIPKCETLLRGTFRYSGYCSILRDFHALNLITEEANSNMTKCNTWEEFIAMQVGAEGKKGSDLKAHLAGMKNKVGENIHVDQLEELGVLSNAPLKQTSCPLDSLAALLDQNCQYLTGERDAILMRHEVTTHENPNTVHGVDFVYYGDQGNKSTSEYSAMAQTVGYPCAIAAHLVLEGQITQPGMVTPLAKDIYKPILSELEKLGITARRTVSSQY